MILKLSFIEIAMCSGGGSCDCVCWKAIDDEVGVEIPFGDTDAIEIKVGFLSLILGGAASLCRAECNFNGYKFRRCDNPNIS